MTDWQKTSHFYDQRTLASQQHQDQATAIPLEFAAPYEYVFKRLELQKTPPSRLLDVGCGHGLHSIRAAQLGFDVVGADISKDSLQVATRMAKKLAAHEKCQFLLCPAEQIEALGQFDALFESGTFYYLTWPTIEALFKSALRQHGRVYLIETLGDSLILKLWRRFRPRQNHRDLMSVHGLWRHKDVERCLSLLQDGEARYFDFFALATILLRRFPSLHKPALHVATKLDDWLLNRFGFHKLAFKVVITGKKKTFNAL
ncbi:MAG: class I SAM-dependent methyltransferase [Bdellovibrionales bacterium]